MQVGIDTVKFERIKKPDLLAEKILSKDELLIYNTLTKRKIEYLASRFCLKEAFVKAYGDTRINYRNINIKEENQKPILVYQNVKNTVSISHEKDYCVCICICY